jgi:hypothetical protein
VPARDLEKIVVERVRAYLGDLGSSLDRSSGEALGAQLLEAKRLSQQLVSSGSAEVRSALLGLVKRVEVGESRIRIEIKSGNEEARTAVLESETVKIRSGREVKLVIPGSEDEIDARRDGKLLALSARAQRVRDRLIAGESIGDIAHDEDSSASRIGRLARLGLLAPVIVSASLEGRQPQSFTRSALWEATRIPLDWTAQRAAFGFS